VFARLCSGIRQQHAQAVKPTDKMKIIISILTIAAFSASVHAADDAKGKGKAKGGKGDPAAAFAKLDKNSDGKISKEEFMASPAAQKDAAKAEESFKKRDKNGDGFLSKEEFAPASKGKGKQ
jgi:hypothetical protein